MTDLDRMPPIAVLCGSTKFRDEFDRLNRTMTLAGLIVLAPGVFIHADDRPVPVVQKQVLDELHRAKIRLADRVFIVNPDDYIGESTTAEIAYARHLGKPITYLRARKEATR